MRKEKFVGEGLATEQLTLPQHTLSDRTVENFERWNANMACRFQRNEPKDAYAFDIEFGHDSSLRTVRQGYGGRYWSDALSPRQSRWPLQRGLGNGGTASGLQLPWRSTVVWKTIYITELPHISCRHSKQWRGRVAFFTREATGNFTQPTRTRYR